MRPTIRLAMATLALSAVAGCKKDTGSQTQTSAGAVAASSGVQVNDVTLGKHLSADKRVADQADTFSPSDTIYASVHTSGSGTTTVAARWTYQDGQVVDQRSESITPSGDTYTEFHVSKPSGWPAGKYTLHVLLDGQEVQTKGFTVGR
jgi:hypothetical protein